MFRYVGCLMLVVIWFVVAAGEGLSQMRLRASYGSLAVSQVVLPLACAPGFFSATVSISNRSTSAADRSLP